MSANRKQVDPQFKNVILPVSFNTRKIVISLVGSAESLPLLDQEA